MIARITAIVMQESGYRGLECKYCFNDGVQNAVGSLWWFGFPW